MGRPQLDDHGAMGGDSGKARDQENERQSIQILKRAANLGLPFGQYTSIAWAGQVNVKSLKGTNSQGSSLLRRIKTALMRKQIMASLALILLSWL